jgi:hypothetical protein
MNERRDGHSALRAVGGTAEQPVLKVFDPHPPKKTIFDEAREIISEWEKDDPSAEHVALVLDGQNDVVIAVTGGPMKPSTAAGLYFTAAQMLIT